MLLPTTQGVDVGVALRLLERRLAFATALCPVAGVPVRSVAGVALLFLFSRLMKGRDVVGQRQDDIGSMLFVERPKREGRLSYDDGS